MGLKFRYRLLLFVALFALLWLSGCTEMGEAVQTQAEANLAGSQAQKAEADAKLAVAEAERIAAQAEADAWREMAVRSARDQELYVAAQEARVREAQLAAIGIGVLLFAVIVVVLVALLRRPITQVMVPSYHLGDAYGTVSARNQQLPAGTPFDEFVAQRRALKAGRGEIVEAGRYHYGK